VACELAVSTNFVDPRHVIIALHLCYRACDTDAVVNIHGALYLLPSHCALLRQPKVSDTRHRRGTGDDAAMQGDVFKPRRPELIQIPFTHR